MAAVYADDRGASARRSTRHKTPRWPTPESRPGGATAGEGFRRILAPHFDGLKPSGRTDGAAAAVRRQLRGLPFVGRYKHLFI